jgi:hypothetical protein
MKQFINFYDDLFKAEDIDEHVMDFFLKDLPVLEELDNIFSLKIYSYNLNNIGAKIINVI